MTEAAQPDRHAAPRRRRRRFFPVRRDSDSLFGGVISRRRRWKPRVGEASLRPPFRPAAAPMRRAASGRRQARDIPVLGRTRNFHSLISRIRSLFARVGNLHGTASNRWAFRDGFPRIGRNAGNSLLFHCWQGTRAALDPPGSSGRRPSLLPALGEKVSPKATDEGQGCPHRKVRRRPSPRPSPRERAEGAGGLQVTSPIRTFAFATLAPRNRVTSGMSAPSSGRR